MGPMGYGRGMMSLAGMARGMGGMNPYQMQMARMAQMQGGYGMRPVGPQANDIQGAAQQQSAYAGQMGAAAAEQPSIQAVGPQENTIMGAQQGGGGLTPQQRAFLGNGPGVWNSGPVNDTGDPFWQRLQAGMAQSAGQPSSFTPIAPQENTIQGAYGAPARGMGGWGGPMSLGALARMGMFRR